MDSWPDRLRAYRSSNEWGDPVHHVICDEAATAIESLRSQLAERDRMLAEARAEIESLRDYIVNGEPQ